MTPLLNFFDVPLFLFSSLVTGPSFNIITGSRVMTIFFYKGLTRKPEIANTPVWVLPNIWRLGKLGISNLAWMSLMKCYWLLQNARITVFTVSQLLQENQGRGYKLPLVHSTLWKFSLHFVHILRTDWKFLTKFGSSNPSFNRSILILMHAQIAVID